MQETEIRAARCGIGRGNTDYCFRCEAYPCDKYDRIDEYDSFITHRNQKADLEKASRIGVDSYNEEQKEKMRILDFLLTNYNDGRKKDVFHFSVTDSSGFGNTRAGLQLSTSGAEIVEKKVLTGNIIKKQRSLSMRTNYKSILIVGVILTMLSVILTGCGKKDKLAYSKPEKLGSYLCYIEYDDFIPEIAGDLAPIEAKGGCSTVRNGNFFGRNLDMNYCECVEFVVLMNASENRFASIGLSANPYIGANVAEMTEDELLRIPTITNDGINENGVLASVHVVLSDGIDDQSGTNAGGEVIDGRYVVRYVLDHAKSAEHAVSLLEKANIVGGFGQYGLHWMIADEKDTYVVEVIGGKLAVSKNEYTYMTNFYLNYGPVQETQTAGGTTFENLPLLNERAIGVERWTYLREHYAESNTAEGMANLMKSVKATTVYAQDENTLWLTEHSADGLTIHSTREDFLRVAAQQQEMYKHRDRANPQGDWITWHTSVYDIEKAKLTVWSQEDYAAPYEFTLK